MKQCPIIGVSGRSSASSLVSVGGIVPHHWCQSEESCPIIGVSGRNSSPSLVSVMKCTFTLEVSREKFTLH
ncbi:unnamed protein product [Staurois parvus]|uniref:Uncharacterized protein n=1 Tax=Staurois parvus TaxID=386267 RepID=A0ABN9EY52_9NEOB|nr:unnamed protein product [Staurois parvus]